MKMPKRTQLYINNELQFKYSLVLVVVVTFEVVLFGGLINFSIRLTCIINLNFALAMPTLTFAFRLMYSRIIDYFLGLFIC